MSGSARLKVAMLVMLAVWAGLGSSAVVGQSVRSGAQSIALRSDVMNRPAMARAELRGFDFLERRVTVDLRDVSLEDALARIARLGDVQLVYSREILPAGDHRVSLRGTKPLADAFATVLEGTDLDLMLSRSGHAVLVTRQPAPPEPEPLPQGSITGRVTSGEGGQPVPGATIRLDASRRWTRTGQDGRYLLTGVPAGTHRVTVEALGLRSESREVAVRSGEAASLDFVLSVEAIPLAAVVVTGTLVPTEIREIPNPVTIITSEEIERLNSRNVAEIFRATVPGGIYTNEGPAARYGSFSVRGVSSLGAASTVKVYIDGVEVSDPAYVTNLDPSVIERIEVLSGPQASTIYGSRAISGVMQIFTKQGQGEGWRRPRISGKAAMHSVEPRYVGARPVGQEYSVTVTGGNETLGYNVGLGYRDEAEWVDLLTQQNTNFFSSVRFASGRFTGGATIRRQAGYDEPAWNPLYRQLFQETGRPDNPPADVYDSTLETYGVRLSFDATDRWTHNVTAGYDGFLRHWYTRRPGPDSLYPVRYNDTYRTSVGYNTSYRLELNQDLTATVSLGADQSRYGLDSYGTIRVRDWRDYEQPPFSTEWRRKSSGYFTQAQLGFRKAVYLTAGLRGDRYPAGSNVGSTWSPRVGLTGIREFGQLTVKPRIAWGQAVIVPDERAVGGDDGPFSLLLPNPDLRAQVQRGYDTGVDLFYADWFSFGVTYFDQDPVDLIQLIRLGTDTTSTPARAIFQNQNLHRVKNRGWEFTAEARPSSRLTVSANYGRTVSTVRSLDASYTGDFRVGDEIPGRPSYMLSGSATFNPVRGTVLTADVVYFASWIAADFRGYLKDVYTGQYNASVRPYPSGYDMSYPALTRLNLGVSQDLMPGMAAFLHVHNLTDSESFERLNMIVPQPRTYTFGLRFAGL